VKNVQSFSGQPAADAEHARAARQQVSVRSTKNILLEGVCALAFVCSVYCKYETITIARANVCLRVHLRIANVKCVLVRGMLVRKTTGDDGRITDEPA